MNKELVNSINNGVNAFKKAFPTKYSTVIKVFDIFVILYSIAKRESNFNVFVENKTNKDYGLYQFIPKTLDGTIKLYQQNADKIKQIKANFYSNNTQTAVETQTFIMCVLLHEYAKYILSKPAAGYYKYFLDSIKDVDLKNIMFAYLMHGGGMAVFEGKEATNYELITMYVDILEIAKEMYKQLYNVDKEIIFDIYSIFDKNPKIDGVTRGALLSYAKQYQEILKKEGVV